MTAANGYNPLRWDCERHGCFNLKRRPKIEVFADCFPGRISLGDVDGIVEIGGNALLLEWKSEACALPTGQRLLYQRLTWSGPVAVMIVVGDAETMTVTATSVFDRGNRYPAEGDMSPPTCHSSRPASPRGVDGRRRTRQCRRTGRGEAVHDGPRPCPRLQPQADDGGERQRPD
jgi:hypothetical protein